MKEILAILRELCPGVDFSDSADFISDGLLNSIDIMGLIARLETDFNIQIDDTDLERGNFVSLESLASLVRKKGGSL